jgi:hypothetical protein
MVLNYVHDSHDPGVQVHRLSLCNGGHAGSSEDNAGHKWGDASGFWPPFTAT